MKLWRTLLTALLLALCAFPASALEPGRRLPPDSAGRERWEQGFFRISYQRQGDSAVPLADANNNNVPDYIEDLGKQLAVAHHIFCTVGGFRSPLESPHFPGLRFIEVYVKSPAAMNGSNGLAFDTAQKAKGPGPKGARALVITLSNAIDPKTNATPAHEYFHQIQNGMTYFKNSWYYEGMARWAEDAVNAVPQGKEVSWQAMNSLLDTATGAESLRGMSYNAAPRLWQPLAHLCSGSSLSLPVTDPVLRTVYSDGSPVVKDREFQGVALMREVLRALEELDEEACKNGAYDRWTEANQRNPLNDAYLREGIRRAVTEVCPAL